MLLKRHLDLYTIGDPLELKSKFWSWYMRALRESHDNSPVLPGSAYYTYGPPPHPGLPVRDRYGDLRRPPPGFFAGDYPPAKFSAGANPTREPWWWSFPELRPFYTPSLPLRSYIPGHSYLSPIKRNYVWSARPHRPYSYRFFY